MYRPAVNEYPASLHPCYMFLSCSLIEYDGSARVVSLEDGCVVWCVPPAINLHRHAALCYHSVNP